MLWKAHQRAVTSIALTPDSSTIVSGDIDGYVYCWDTIHGKRINTIRIASQKGFGIYKIMFSPDGNQLALSWNRSGGKGQLEVYDTQNWKLQYTYTNSLKILKSGISL